MAKHTAHTVERGGFILIYIWDGMHLEWIQVLLKHQDSYYRFLKFDLTELTKTPVKVLKGTQMENKYSKNKNKNPLDFLCKFEDTLLPIQEAFF